MPIIKSAKKAARQAEKRTANNQLIKKNIKAALKAKKGLLKKNTASRRKAALAKFAKANKATA